MRLYPESLIVTAAVLLPNLLYLGFPPRRAEKYGRPKDSLAFTAIERAGQISSFILPLFYPLSFAGPLAVAAWTLMGFALGLYYAGWIRFFAGGRDYALLFRPLVGIPVPMAVSPVAFFLVSSFVLGSLWQVVAAIVLGIGHITITAQEQLRVSRREPQQVPSG